MEFVPIAHVRSDFKEKFGIPRQSGLVPETLSRIVFDEGFRREEALRGIEGFSHLWIIWVFSANAGSRPICISRWAETGGSAYLPRGLRIVRTRSACPA